MLTGKSMQKRVGWGAGAEGTPTEASSPVYSVYWCSSARYITIFCKPFVKEVERVSPLQFCLDQRATSMHVWREKPGETDYEELALQV